MTLDHPKLKKIIAQCERRVKKLTGNSTLKVTAYETPKEKIPFSLIVSCACKVMKVSTAKVFEKCRKRELILCRQLIYYYAKYAGRMTLNQIGQRTGGVHHTTVMSGLRRLNSLLSSRDSIVCDAIKNINNELYTKQ